MSVFRQFNAEDNKQFKCYTCVKFFGGKIFNAYIQSRTLYTYLRECFTKKLLEPKRMQVVPLKIQYKKYQPTSLKEKKRSVIAYEFHMMSDYNVRYTL